MPHQGETKGLRFGCSLCCAEPHGLPGFPIPHLCPAVLCFPSLALHYFSPRRVPVSSSLPSCSSICVWVPQHSDLPRQLLPSQPSSVLIVTAFLLQKSLSLSWKEKCVHKKASVSAQLPSLLASKGNSQQLEQHQEITQFLYLCTNGLLLPFCSARESCQSTQSHCYLFSNTRQSHQCFFCCLAWTYCVLICM